jgi:hypothetical protein
MIFNKKVFLCIILTIICILLLRGQSTTVISPIFKCTKKVESPYGIVDHIIRLDYKNRNINLNCIKNVNINFIRTDFDWYNCMDLKNGICIIPEKFDSVIIGCQSYNVNILPILNYEVRKHYCWNDMEDYLNYVQFLVHRYKNIHYWEIMNEINLIHINNKDSLADLYVKVLERVYKLIKRENKNTQVLLSGLGNINDGFLERICKRGGYKYFDIMNFHNYDNPENLPNSFSFEYISSEMNKYKWNKPVWMTETGFTTVLYPYEIGKLTVSNKETIQAKRLPRAYLISFAYGIDKVFWYHLHAIEKSDTDPESHFGILHKNYSPLPAYDAYKTLTTMCPNGSTRPSLEIKDNIYISKWKKPNGINVEAIWSINGKKKLQLNIPPNIKCYNYLGESVKINNDLYADDGILYFVEVNMN